MATVSALKDKLGLRNEPIKFIDPVSAVNFAARCEKLHFVVMGDFPFYWVACMSDTIKLEKSGYEILGK